MDHANRILTWLTVYFSTVFIVRLTYRFQRTQLDNLFLKQYPFYVFCMRSGFQNDFDDNGVFFAQNNVVYIADRDV